MLSRDAIKTYESLRYSVYSDSNSAVYLWVSWLVSCILGVYEEEEEEDKEEERCRHVSRTPTRRAVGSVLERKRRGEGEGGGRRAI